MNEVTKFMWYVFNKWSFEEAQVVFNDFFLAKHIYTKWIERTDTLIWYSELDDECRQKLVDRANEIYS